METHAEPPGAGVVAGPTGRDPHAVAATPPACRDGAARRTARRPTHRGPRSVVTGQCRDRSAPIPALSTRHTRSSTTITVRRGTASGIDGAYRRIAADSGHATPTRSSRRRHERLRGAARLAQPSPARQLRRHRVRDAEPRPLRARARDPLHPPRHRLAAVHAGAPRHPRRRARLPLEAVGIDRAVGAADHARARRVGRDDDARHRPSAPVRDRRRELPRRLLGLGLRARATRATRGARTPIRRGSGTPTLPARTAGLVLRAHARRRRGHPRLRPVAHVLPGRGGLPRAARHARGGPVPHRRDAVPRPLVPLRRRVRPARAVRHAGTVGRSLRRRAVDRRPAHLAAVRRRRHRAATSSPSARAGTSAGTTAASCR